MENVIWVYGMTNPKKFEIIYKNLSTKNPNLSNLTNFKKDIYPILGKVAAIVDRPQFTWEGKNVQCLRRKDIMGYDRIFLNDIGVHHLINPTTLAPIVEYSYLFAQPDCKNHIRISKINSILEE